MALIRSALSSLLLAGYYMTVDSKSDSYGQNAMITSPSHEFFGGTVIEFSISMKKRSYDFLPALKVILTENMNEREFIYNTSTNGFEKRYLCVRPGIVTLSFLFTWGKYSSPYVALDNVTITNAACNPSTFCKLLFDCSY